VTLYGLLTEDGAVTGGCINPAVALVQTIFQHIVDPTLSMASMWIYLLAGIIGGLLAGFFIKL
jgi:glycerol uptake facilitator-like aquaporin